MTIDTQTQEKSERRVRAAAFFARLPEGTQLIGIRVWLDEYVVMARYPGEVWNNVTVLVANLLELRWEGGLLKTERTFPDLLAGIHQATGRAFEGVRL